MEITPYMAKWLYEWLYVNFTAKLLENGRSQKK